jgi:hypothetical protein
VLFEGFSVNFVPWKVFSRGNSLESLSFFEASSKFLEWEKGAWNFKENFIIFQEKTSFLNTPRKTQKKKPKKNYCVQFGENFALNYAKR